MINSGYPRDFEAEASKIFVMTVRRKRQTHPSVILLTG
jgi:hypothetical protein